VTKHPARLNPADVLILRAVNRFRYLTAGQLNRVLWPDNTRDENRYAQRRLHRLSEDEYILPLRELPRPATGAAPRVHALAWRGRKVLLELGDEVPSYYRPSEIHQSAENPLFMPHTLAVVDVLIAAERLTQDISNVQLHRLYLERDLRRMSLRVFVQPSSDHAQARRATVVPDAVFTLSVDGVEQHFILELDRGTERQQVWRNKVAALGLWLASPDRKSLLPGEYVTVMIVVPDARRREYLRAWTAQELRARWLYEEYSYLFAVSEVSPVTVSPLHFFSGAHWHPVGVGAPDSLIDIAGGEQFA
jgi:hypothetical protein